MNKFTFIDLFAGIGGIRIAFERVGGKCVFSSEIDKFAQKTYEANFGEDPSGDITKIDAKDIPSFDVLCAGFPCQPYSRAGNRMGFDDPRGNTFWDIVRIVDYHQPKVVFLENVVGLMQHDTGLTFLTMTNAFLDRGYYLYCKEFNAKDFGLPQNRDRAYLVFMKVGGIDLFKSVPMFEPVILGNILEPLVDPKYTISDKLWAGHIRRKEEHKIKGNGFGFKLFNYYSPYTSTLSARYGKDGSEILIEQKDANPRKLTPRECARLQGFPDSFNIPVSDTQAYKQFGNSVAIPVVEFIAKEIVKYL